jgi:zinc resistance-associated protein
MKKMGKVSLLLAVALVLSLGLGAPSWAQPMGKGMMGKGMHRGHWMMNLTPEQAGKLFDLKEKFRTDTANLRKGLLIKRLEMRALWKAEKPDEKAILAKQKEINALRDQMAEKMVPFRLEAKKIAPNCAMGWHGMGQGMGMGMGPGGMGMMPPPESAK